MAASNLPANPRALFDVPEEFEAQPGAVISARGEQLTSFRKLGPYDLCHVMRADPKTGRLVSSYHQVVGVDASSPRSIANYISLLKYSLESRSLESASSSSSPSSSSVSAGRGTLPARRSSFSATTTSASNNSSNSLSDLPQSMAGGVGAGSALTVGMRVTGVIYCCYNPFAKMDLLVEARFPLALKIEALGFDGHRLPVADDDEDPTFWDQMHVSSVLRALAAGAVFPPPTAEQGACLYRVAPLPDLQTEEKFFSAVKRVFKYSPELGCDPYLQPATLTDNLLVHTLVDAFGHSTLRWETLISLWSSLLPLSDSVGGLLAQAYAALGRDGLAARVLHKCIKKSPKDSTLLLAQARFLLSRGRVNDALQVSRYLLTFAPLEFRGWEVLVDCYAASGDWSIALLALNSSPLLHPVKEDVIQNLWQYRIAEHIPGLSPEQQQQQQQNDAYLLNAEGLLLTVAATELGTGVPDPLAFANTALNPVTFVPAFANPATLSAALALPPSNMQKKQQQHQGSNTNLTSNANSSATSNSSASSISLGGTANNGSGTNAPVVASATLAGKVTSCENGFKLLGPASGLGPYRALYSVLARIVNKATWQKVLEHRAMVFLMESENKGVSQNASPETSSSSSSSDHTLPQAGSARLRASSNVGSSPLVGDGGGSSNAGSVATHTTAGSDYKDMIADEGDEDPYVSEDSADAAGEEVEEDLELAKTSGEKKEEVISLARLARADTARKRKSRELRNRVYDKIWSKRRCEQWVNDIFYVMYKDLRTYAARCGNLSTGLDGCETESANDGRPPSAAAGGVVNLGPANSIAQLEALGDTAYRLCLWRDAARLYALRCRASFSPRLLSRLVVLLCDLGELSHALRWFAELHAHGAPGLTYRVCGKAVWPDPVASAILRLVARLGLERVRAEGVRVGLPPVPFRQLLDILAYAERVDAPGARPARLVPTGNSGGSTPRTHIYGE